MPSSLPSFGMTYRYSGKRWDLHKRVHVALMWCKLWLGLGLMGTRAIALAITKTPSAQIEGFQNVLAYVRGTPVSCVTKGGLARGV
jgi:hypothetical protein